MCERHSEEESLVSGIARVEDIEVYVEKDVMEIGELRKKQFEKEKGRGLCFF